MVYIEAQTQPLPAFAHVASKPSLTCTPYPYAAGATPPFRLGHRRLHLSFHA